MKPTRLFFFALSLFLLVAGCSNPQLQVTQAEVCLVNQSNNTTCFQDSDKFYRLNLVNGSLSLDSVPGSQELGLDIGDFRQYDQMNQIFNDTFALSVQDSLITIGMAGGSLTYDGEIGYLLRRTPKGEALLAPPVNPNPAPRPITFSGNQVLLDGDPLGFDPQFKTDTLDIDADGTLILRQTISVTQSQNGSVGSSGLTANSGQGPQPPVFFAAAPAARQEIGTDIVIIDDMDPNFALGCCSPQTSLCCSSSPARTLNTQSDTIVFSGPQTWPSSDVCVTVSIDRVVVYDCKSSTTTCFNTRTCPVEITHAGGMVSVSTNGCTATSMAAVCSPSAN